MLDIEGIGRIIVSICKDVTNSKIKEFVGEVKGDILCYPAYSPSLEVIPRSQSLTTDFNVISIFSNACAPRFTNEEIGYCAVPQRNGTMSSAHVCKYGCDKQMCNNLCRYKTITIKFTDFEFINNKLNCLIDID